MNSISSPEAWALVCFLAQDHNELGVISIWGLLDWIFQINQFHLKMLNILKCAGPSLFPATPLLVLNPNISDLESYGLVWSTCHSI